MQRKKQHPIIAFLIGIAMSSSLLLCTYFLFCIFTFDLGGGETLQTIELRYSFLLLLFTLISGITTYKARQFIQFGLIWKAIGIGVLPVITWIAICIFYFSFIFGHEPFNKEEWDESRWKPFEMAKSFVREDVLIGLSKDQIKHKLGEGEKRNNAQERPDSSLEYLIEDNWTMTIYFHQDTVSSVFLRLPYLGV